MVADIEIIAMLCTNPAASNVAMPTPTRPTCANTSSSAYHSAVCTSVARAGRSGPPVTTIVIEPASAPSEKLAASRPRPRASTW